MADTRISKIQQRTGNFADLPILSTAELGYAKDERRLFIGNDPITVGTGNGANTVFVVDIDVNNPGVIQVAVDGTQINAVDYSLVGTTLTLANAPAAGETVVVYFNSEIEIAKDVERPTVVSLPANGNLAETGFAFDTTVADAIIMNYTLASTNGVRIGQLRIAVDTGSSTFAIDDNYTESATIDVVFGVDISTANTAKLIYTDNDNAISTFKFTYQLWKS